jgi:hypothetical protein
VQPPPPPPPPPLLLLPPQAGIKKRAVRTIPTIKKPSNFFLRERAELKPIPTNDRPAIGSHIA